MSGDPHVLLLDEPVERGRSRRSTFRDDRPGRDLDGEPDADVGRDLVVGTAARTVTTGPLPT